MSLIQYPVLILTSKAKIHRYQGLRSGHLCKGEGFILPTIVILILNATILVTSLMKSYHLSLSSFSSSSFSIKSLANNEFCSILSNECVCFNGRVYVCVCVCVCVYFSEQKKAKIKQKEWLGKIFFKNPKYWVGLPI